VPVALAEPRPAGAAVSPRQQQWRRWRLPLAVAAAIIGTALVGLALLRPTTTGYLDPDNVRPEGTRALVQIMRDQGVDVRVRTRFDDVAADLQAPGGSTLVLARPELLLGERTQDLRRAVSGASADLVLVGPGPALLADLDLPVVPAENEDDLAVREPGCSDPVASRAGPARLGEVDYLVRLGSDQPLTSCYRDAQGAGYVVVPDPGGGRTTVLGSGAPLTNELLAQDGNAALAIGTIGAQQRVVWWTPNPADTGAVAAPSLRDLLPRGLVWAVAQLAVALLVVMLWRGRRLGRLVTEPLPVVVRSVETTLGRAQLYRRARARGRAAQVLRAATVRRIAVRCNLPRTADPRDVAAAAAARTRRPVADVTALLVGGDPPDDAALVALARQLDALDTEVRTT